MTRRDETARPDVSAYPLIIFVHVPETARSTIKIVLDRCTPGGIDEMQDVIDHPLEDLNSFVAAAFWIGGHVPRDALAKALIWLDRPVEYFSAVREPVAQLVSDLNFSFERFGNRNYYVELSQEQQRVDADVMSTDFSNPAAVRKLLFRHAELYLNIQSRYILGEDFAIISDSEMARRLTTYSYVANETNLPKLYRAFGFAQLPKATNSFRVKAAKPHINPHVFDSPQMREFLAHHHNHDLRLYSAVRKTSWPAEGRAPFRPAYLALPGSPVFTLENYDEQTYLECNPDVAFEVRRGRCPSGREHFERYGHREGRMIRRWVFPPAPAVEAKPTESDIAPSTVLDRVRKLHEERERIVDKSNLRRRELAESDVGAGIAET